MRKPTIVAVLTLLMTIPAAMAEELPKVTTILPPDPSPVRSPAEIDARESQFDFLPKPRSTVTDLSPTEIEKRCRMQGFGCNVHVVSPEALRDPKTDKLWEQFDAQHRVGTLDKAPSRSIQPLTKDQQNTIDTARKMQCIMNPKMC